MAPLVDGDTIYISQAEENLDNTTMGSVTAFKGIGSGDITATAAIWQKKGVMDGRSMPVLLGQRLYCVDDGAKVYGYDKATGQQVGRPHKLLGTIVRGSPLVAGGKLYICSTGGWHVLLPTADGLTTVNRMRLDEDDEVTASPIAWNGRIYLTTGARLYCLGDALAGASTGDGVALPTGTLTAAASRTLPEHISQATAGSPGEPAWVQVIPAEAQIAAGNSVQFTVRLFDNGGRFIKECPADFSVDQGAVTPEGRYTSPPGKHSGAIVTAKVGSLEGKARVRSMPPLPWVFDFEDITLLPNPKGGPPRGEPPLPWIGMRYRHVVRDVDGSKCLVKVTTIPKGTRSQGWIGPIELHDYRVQADFRAQETGVEVPGNPTPLEKARMPDMGLVAQRYTLDLMGASQQLQVRSWPSQVATHFAKTIPFAWEAGRWYTIQFEARTGIDSRATAGSEKPLANAILRAKVWLRGEPEPKEWTIEAVHEAGNLQGSPGFFGNSKDSEISIDNVLVTPVSQEPSAH